MDFHYEVNGKMYEFSIPGGGFASFYKIVEVLGISNQGTQNEFVGENAENEGENATENSKIEVGNGKNTDGNDVYNEVEESGVEDTGIYSDAISLNNVEVSDATRQFLADVASVEFSNSELVWVGKVEDATTVGGLKEANGLEVQYSAELTEEQIAEINGTIVESGDWALISTRPFDTEESLTVTMKNGDQFLVKVTDGQEATEVSDIDTDVFYVIYVDRFYNNTHHFYALRNDGASVAVTNNNLDALGTEFTWRLIEEAAGITEGKDVEIWTLGLALERVGNNKQKLMDLASDGCYSGNAEDADQLVAETKKILEEMLVKATVIGEVYDTVDPAFYPIDSSGNPIEEGYYYAETTGGSVTRHLSAPSDVKKAYYHWINDNGTWSIAYYNQEIKWPEDGGWKESFFIKAKEDFWVAILFQLTVVLITGLRRIV